MKLARVLWAGAALVALYLALVLGTQQHRAGSAAGDAGGSSRWVNLLEDPYDRFAYQQRGRWYPAGGQPYLDVFSEYPQLTTWFFATGYWFFDHGTERGEPFTSEHAAVAALLELGMPQKQCESVARKTPKAQRAVVLQQLPRGPKGQLAAAALERAFAAQDRLSDELVRNAEAYGRVHQALMAPFYFLLFLLVALCLREFGAPPAWALVLFLPGPAFYAYNRFDVLPMALVLGAVYAELRGRKIGAGVLLGLAAMTKIWPLALLPLFVSHQLASTWPAVRATGTRGVARWLWREAVLPSAACGLVCVLVLGITYGYAGGGEAGFEAVTGVYRWHDEERKPNHSSVLALMTASERWGWLPLEARERWEQIFKVLQFVPALLLGALGLRTRAAWLHALCFSTLSCVIFQKFFSPQWVLWILPLALPLVGTLRAYKWLYPLLALLIYVQLPLLYYHDGAVTAQGFELSARFWYVTNARVALLFVLWGAALWATLAEIRRARSAGSAAR
jgi:hypothetical protein